MFIRAMANPGSVPGHPCLSDGRGADIWLFGKEVCMYPSFAGWCDGRRGSHSTPAPVSLFSGSPSGNGTEAATPLWSGTGGGKKAAVCPVSPATTPSPQAVFQTIYLLMPCCISLVRKKCFSPRNGTNNGGVEDNFNDTILALVHGFREIHPSQNSDHFRTRDKSFSWLPADGRLRKMQYWVPWPLLNVLARCYIWYWPSLRATELVGVNITKHVFCLSCKVIWYFPDLCESFFSSKQQSALQMPEVTATTQSVFMS